MGKERYQLFAKGIDGSYTWRYGVWDSELKKWTGAEDEDYLSIRTYVERLNATIKGEMK